MTNEALDKAIKMAEERGLNVRTYSTFYLLDGNRALASFRDERGIIDYLNKHKDLRK